MTGELVTTIYRHLLRSTSHAVRHDRAASKNIRRLLRDDFENAVKANASEEQLVQQAESTILLHLASTRAKEDKSAGNLLAHRTLRNLSSLCYHHLSSHTQMQPNTKKNRIGGTDSASLRRIRGSIGMRSKVQNGASLALGSFESNSLSSNTGNAANVAQVLPSLAVMAKPVRGPIISSLNRRFSPGRWDGQNPVKTIQTSSAFMAHLQSMVDSMKEEIEQLIYQYGPHAPQVIASREKLKLIKGQVKGALTSKKHAEHRRTIQSEAANSLQRLVKRSQDNNGPWLGAHRFKMWATGVWLPP